MFKIIKKLSKQEIFFAVVSVAFIVLQVWLDLLLPDYMNEITLIIQTPGSQINEILIAGGKMLASALASLGTSIIVNVLASRISSTFGARLRELLFDKVQSFSLEEISGFSTSSLITRSTNDIVQVQMLIVMGLQVIVKAPIMGVWAITRIAGQSWQWTFSTGVSIVILFIIVGICVALALPKMKAIQKLTDKLNSVTRENLTGLEVVRAYNGEDYQEKKFEKANDDLTSTNIFTNRTMAFMMPGIQLVLNGLTLAIYWIGAYLINEAASIEVQISLFSEMIVFSTYAMQVIMAFMMLIMIFIILPRATVAANRVSEVLETEPKIVDGKLNAEEILTDVKGKIEFKNVGFKYPNAEDSVLEDINFTANKGETVAFIGSTGSGKSTLINLVPRLFDVTEGIVTVNDIDVKDYKQFDLHNKIGYVSQKAILFGGTISSNVAYGDNGKHSDQSADIVASIRTAQATEFVEEMDEGYDSFVAQNGSNLSGGQKQRVSIARAINRQPEIFIFDDSFSALDYKTDRELRRALARDCKDATKLVVAQRIGTIRDADQIIVLDEGKMVGIGKHHELMETCETYQQIAYSQLSKEELA